MNLHFEDIMSHLVDRDEPVKPRPAVAPEAAAVPVPAPAIPVDISAPDRNDSVYQHLLTKTDFATTLVFQTINKYLTPIASLPMAEKTKFKTAILQAQAHENISPEAILAVFDGCFRSLQDDQSMFVAAMDKAARETVTSPQTKAAVIAEQIQKLQATAAQLTEDAFAAQQKIQAAGHRYEIALQTRKAELTQEQARYAGLLQ